MSVVTEKEPMGKSRGRPRSERDDVTVKIDRAIASKAKLIAAHEGIAGGVAELLSESLRTMIDKRYRKMLGDLDERKEQG